MKRCSKRFYCSSLHDWCKCTCEEKTMNIDEQIKILQAYKDGKPLEYRTKRDTTWFRILDPENWPFNFEEDEYRIKQEPREFYVWQYPNGAIRGYKDLSRMTGPGEIIKVREVVDEQ